MDFSAETLAVLWWALIPHGSNCIWQLVKFANQIEISSRVATLPFTKAFHVGIHYLKWLVEFGERTFP